MISPATVANWLDAAAVSAGLRDTDGSPLTFSPHDFRRVFLTDAVRNGLPIHIVAQLAGHDDLNTTRRYANYRELHQMGALPQVAWRVGEGNGPITSGRHAA